MSSSVSTLMALALREPRGRDKLVVGTPGRGGGDDRAADDPEAFQVDPLETAARRQELGQRLSGRHGA
jgi:hypothetical protein